MKNKMLRILLLGLGFSFVVQFILRSLSNPEYAKYRHSDGVHYANQSHELPPIRHGVSFEPLKVTEKSHQNQLLQKALELLTTGMSSPGQMIDHDVLDHLVKSFSKKDLIQLQDNVLNPSLDRKTRRASIYILTLIGNSAISQLTEVAKSEIPTLDHGNNPHSSGFMDTQFEKSLRVSALEAIDKLTVKSAEAADQLLEIKMFQKDSGLILMTNISLAGVREGRPGKLSRAIEAMMKRQGEL